jgi:hypothetical protein
MSKIKKRNHYLPRFYLKGFCDTNSRVWMYEKNNPSQPVDGSPGDMAIVRKLYNLESSGNAKDEIENYFSESVETPASPPFKRLLNKEFPNMQDKKTLSLFFAMLMVRTPLYIKHLKTQQSKEFNVIAKVSAANKDYFHSAYKKIHSNLDEGAIEKDRCSILNGEVCFEAINDVSLKSMLILGVNIAPLLENMKWALIETDDNLPLITSDNFMHISNLNIKSSFYGIGLGMSGTYVYIPLSKKLSLLMVNKCDFNENIVYNVNNPPSLNDRKIDLKKFIKLCNKKIFCACERYVFANSNSEELKRCFSNLLNEAKSIEENFKKDND